MNLLMVAWGFLFDDISLNHLNSTDIDIVCVLLNRGVQDIVETNIAEEYD